MEPHSRTEDPPRSRTVLEGQLRECFGRVVYSHKTHEKCADILLSRLNRIKVARIALAALTTGGFLATVFSAGTITTVVGAICSTALLALNAYTKSFDHGELAQKHKLVASELWLIREKYLSLLTDLAMGEKPIETLPASRDELLKNLHTAYASAPATNSAAYAEAQKALKFARTSHSLTEKSTRSFLRPSNGVAFNRSRSFRRGPCRGNLGPSHGKVQCATCAA